MQPQEQNPYGYGQGSNQGGYAATVADAAVEDRSTFIVRTYAHLAGAIFAFVARSWGFAVFGRLCGIAMLFCGLARRDFAEHCFRSSGAAFAQLRPGASFPR